MSFSWFSCNVSVIVVCCCCVFCCIVVFLCFLFCYSIYSTGERIDVQEMVFSRSCSPSGFVPFGWSLNFLEPFILLGLFCLAGGT